MSSPDNTRPKVLLSLQRALLGNVFDALRAVGVDYAESMIRITCYVQGDLAKEDKESIENMETQIHSDVDPSTKVEVSTIRRDAPEKLGTHLAWAYQRRESAIRLVKS